MDLMEHTFMHMAKLGRMDLREAIAWMQEHISAMPERGSIWDCPVRNVFAPGTYCREITMPEGLIIVGRIHRHAHTNIISRGRCRVLTEWGTEEIVGPCVFNSEPGTQRIVYVLEDTVWTTVHANPTNETDVDKLLDMLSVQDHGELEIQGEVI